MSVEHKIQRPVPGVAVDFDDCDCFIYWGKVRKCRCGNCAICGHPKHDGLHGGLFGDPLGGQPYHHEYKEKS